MSGKRTIKLKLTKESLSKTLGTIGHRTTFRCHETIVQTLCENTGCDTCYNRGYDSYCVC